MHKLGSSLFAQWLGLWAFSRGSGSIPSWGTKILQAMWHAPPQGKPHTHTHTHTHRVGEKEKEDEEEEVEWKGERQAGREGEMKERKRERFNKEHLMMKDH